MNGKDKLKLLKTMKEKSNLQEKHDYSKLSSDLSHRNVQSISKLSDDVPKPVKTIALNQLNNSFLPNSCIIYNYTIYHILIYL